MAEERIQRRLAAILAADVVGFSRLMEADESGTLTALKSRRKDVLDPLVARHQGRIFKVTGDGVLVEFGSAVNALQCAVDLQQAMAAANGDQPNEGHIVLRIGVNLGDIMVEGDDLYGDGVNIAARLESLAEPGGILVSGTTFDYVRNKVKVGFDDLGSQNLKNIAEPIRAYRVAGTPVPMIRPPSTTSEKPAIAVLPFTNMSGDPEQEYFSDGITEGIITELSRFKSLPVIAHNSSAKFGSQTADIGSLRRSLDVDYIVQGSVRKIKTQIRITVQLVDARTGGCLWSERYDRMLNDVFAAQDEIVALIVGVIEGRMIVAGAERATRKPPSNMRAYDYVLRAMALPSEDPDAEQEMVQLMEKAIALDPAYGLPYALLSEVAMMRWFRDMKRPKEDLDEICKMAEKAVRLDDSESISHSILSWVYLYRKSYDLAEFHGERALTLTPNRSQVLADQCELLTLLGRPLEAVASLNRARQLDPYHPRWFWWNLGRAYYVARQYPDAIAAFAHVGNLPYFAHAYAAACHAQMGQPDLARSHVDTVMQLEPDFSLRYFMETEPFKRESDTAHMLDGLRKAGLPD
jgi:TolB-like protein